MDVFEADLWIYGIILFVPERSIHTGSRLAALMARDTKIRVIGNKVTLGVLSAKADTFAAGEDNRFYFIAIRPVGFIMAGRAHETIAWVLGAHTRVHCRAVR